MIDEKELAELSYPEAPKIVTKGVPGPKGKKVLEDISFRTQITGCIKFI